MAIQTHPPPPIAGGFLCAENLTRWPLDRRATLAMTAVGAYDLAVAFRSLSASGEAKRPARVNRRGLVGEVAAGGDRRGGGRPIEEPGARMRQRVSLRQPAGDRAPVRGGAAVDGDDRALGHEPVAPGLTVEAGCSGAGNQASLALPARDAARPFRGVHQRWRLRLREERSDVAIQTHPPPPIAGGFLCAESLTRWPLDRGATLAMTAVGAYGRAFAFRSLSAFGEPKRPARGNRGDLVSEVAAGGDRRGGGRPIEEPGARMRQRVSLRQPAGDRAPVRGGAAVDGDDRALGHEPVAPGLTVEAGCSGAGNQASLALPARDAARPFRGVHQRWRLRLREERSGVAIQTHPPPPIAGGFLCAENLTRWPLDRRATLAMTAVGVYGWAFAFRSLSAFGEPKRPARGNRRGLVGEVAARGDRRGDGRPMEETGARMRQGERFREPAGDRAPVRGGAAVDGDDRALTHGLIAPPH